MTSKKYLSNKRTAQQTISTSPAIKDWVTRYVHINHKKKPNDERYRSISSFYNYIMENILELFEEGKTIDDLKRLEHKKTRDFFDRFTFKATIPLYEMVVESNKYTHFSFEFNIRFLLMYLDFFRNEVKSHNFDDVRLFFEKIRSRYAISNVSKDMRLEIFPRKDNLPAKGTLEFIGKFKNLHFENCKFFAAIFGILGVRVTDFIYSPEDYYCRLELLETELLFNKDLAKKQRLKLIKENVDFIININKMLDDKDKYLWMKLAEDNEIFINFKSTKVFEKWIEFIEEDLRKFGTKETFPHKILQFFSKIHWIRIENLNELSFIIEPVIEKNNEQKQLLVDYLSQYSEIKQINKCYYLK